MTIMIVIMINDRYSDNDNDNEKLIDTQLTTPLERLFRDSETKKQTNENNRVNDIPTGGR